MTRFIPAPTQWVATGKAFMINSVHKHIGKKVCGGGEGSPVYWHFKHCDFDSI